MNNLKFQDEKEVRFIWVNDTHQTEIMIKIPNTQSNKISSWGDWGPMWQIFLHPCEPISINYRSDENEPWEERQLDLPSFHLNTPREAFLRKKFPLVYEIEDKVKEISFKLYAIQDGSIEKVEVLEKVESLGVNYCILKVS